MTLKELLALHPEWADLPMVVLGHSGEYAEVGGAALVYEDDGMLVFTDE